MENKFKSSSLLSIILFLISPFLSIPVIIRNALKRDKTSLFLFIAILGLISFLLIPNFDHDKTRYFERFRYLQDTDLKSFLLYVEVNSSDYIFISLIYLFAYLGIPLEFLFLACTVATLWLLKNFLEKFVQSTDYFPYLFFILFLFFSISIPALFSSVRFLFGISVLLNGAYLLLWQRKIGLASFLIFIAIQIHFSLMFIVIFLFILYFDKGSRLNYLLIFYCSFVFYFITPLEIMKLTSYIGFAGNIGNKIETYILGEDFITNTAKSNFSNYIVYLINIAWYFPAILYVLWRRLTPLFKTRQGMFLTNMMLLFFAANNFFFILPTVFSRYTQFTKYLFIAYLIFDISRNFRTPKVRVVQRVFLLIFFLNILVSVNAFRYNLAASLFKIENISLVYLLQERITFDELL